MSTIATDPSLHIWWLASRAAGIVARGLITASVMLGLAMANKLLRGRNYAAIHEHLSVAGLVAILAHGVTLLGDSWLHPGLVGIAVPFTMGYRTVFTGLGIMAVDLAAALGVSFYVRRRIGARLWRKAHRFTPVVYLLALVHALGAGTDASTSWLRTFMLATGVPILALIGMLFAARTVEHPEAATARQERAKPEAGCAPEQPERDRAPARLSSRASRSGAGPSCRCRLSPCASSSGVPSRRPSTSRAASRCSTSRASSTSSCSTSGAAAPRARGPAARAGRGADAQALRRHRPARRA